MALIAAGSVFGVFLLSVAGVLGQYGWDVTFTRTRICVLKGLSVDVSCTYRYPSGHEIIKTEWYKWWNVTVGYTYNIMEQPKYAGRVEYLGNNHSDCTLRITDLRENDTAEYCFGFKTNIQGWIYQQDLFISVTDLKVTANVTEGSWVILNCSTTCTLSDNPNPDYIWYKNGNPLHECMSQNYSILSSDEDSYSCAVKGHEDHRSPAVCAVGQNCWRVIYAKRSICALKGSSVDISCTYTYPLGHLPRDTFWFTQGNSTKEPKDLKKDPNFLDRLEYHGNEDSNCTLRIKDLKDSDSAEYKFRLVTAEGKHVSSPGVYLTVTYVLLEINPMSVSEGERAKLRCTTNCILGDNTAFIWYKNGQAIPNSHTYCNSLHLGPVSSEDAGSYSCAVGHEYLHSPEVTLTIRYYPKNISVSVSPSGEIVEGSSVTLTCRSDANPPVQKYTWYKRNINTSKASGQIYNIAYISSEDSGEYYCEAQNEMGAKNSTVRLIIVSGKQTSSINIAVGITVVALVLILLFSFLWFRKRASKSIDTRDTVEDGQGGSSHLYDTFLRTAPTAAQRADTDAQDVRIYANVHFSHSRNHEEPLYSTVQLPNPEKQDNKVQYAALKFNRIGVAPHPAAHAAEDPSAIYSTVNKPRTRTQEGTFLSSYPTFPRPPTGPLYSY